MKTLSFLVVILSAGAVNAHASFYGPCFTKLDVNRLPWENRRTGDLTSLVRTLYIFFDERTADYLGDCRDFLPIAEFEDDRTEIFYVDDPGVWQDFLSKLALEDTPNAAGVVIRYADNSVTRQEIVTKIVNWVDISLADRKRVSYVKTRSFVQRIGWPHRDFSPAPLAAKAPDAQRNLSFYERCFEKLNSNSQPWESYRPRGAGMGDAERVWVFFDKRASSFSGDCTDLLMIISPRLEFFRRHAFYIDDESEWKALLTKMGLKDSDDTAGIQVQFYRFLDPESKGEGIKMRQRIGKMSFSWQDILRRGDSKVDYLRVKIVLRSAPAEVFTGE